MIDNLRHIDTSLLTQEEIAKIDHVLRNIDRANQNIRIAKLKESIQSLESKSIDIPPELKETAKVCSRCRQRFSNFGVFMNYFFSPPEQCVKCGYKICSNCLAKQIDENVVKSTEKKVPICNLCNMKMQYLMLTGEWIHLNETTKPIAQEPQAQLKPALSTQKSKDLTILKSASKTVASLVIPVAERLDKPSSPIHSPRTPTSPFSFISKLVMQPNSPALSNATSGPILKRQESTTFKYPNIKSDSEDFDSVVSSDLDDISRKSYLPAPATHQQPLTPTQSTLPRTHQAGLDHNKLAKFKSVELLQNKNYEKPVAEKAVSSVDLNPYLSIKRENRPMEIKNPTISSLLEPNFGETTSKKTPSIQISEHVDILNSANLKPLIASNLRTSEDVADQQEKEYLRKEKARFESKLQVKRNDDLENSLDQSTSTYSLKPRSKFTRFRSLRSLSGDRARSKMVQQSASMKIKISYEKMTSHLNVTVYKCLNLGAEYNAYVKVWLEPADTFAKRDKRDKENLKRKTNIQKRQENPRFNETFQYSVSSHEINQYRLLFIVCYKDKIGRSRSLGHVTVDLTADFLEESTNTYLNYELESSNNQY